MSSSASRPAAKAGAADVFVQADIFLIHIPCQNYGFNAVKGLAKRHPIGKTGKIRY